MIIGLQIIALLFALLMIYLAYSHYRKGEIGGIEILSWMVIWAGAILIIAFPELFRVFAKTIAISRAFDLAVLGAFVLIIPLIYMAYIRSKRLEKKFENFIRSESLKVISKNKSKPIQKRK